nr:homoserine dehydrogenase [Propionicicella superfundia]
MTLDESAPVRVALLGAGVVGSQVARLLTENSDDLRARVGRAIELVGVGVRRTGIERPGIDPALFTSDLESLVSRPDVDIVIELIGGIEPARTLLLAALSAGKSVVTANKALLADHSHELFQAAAAARVDLYFEAAVAGAIPIIRPLRESLVGDEITTIMGIVNGTTNYILDQMTAEGTDFAGALAEAQRLGFAEADPTADVEGDDAAAKAALLASLAFHTRVRGSDVPRAGISDITADDVAAAKALNCTIKLVAVCSLSEDDRISLGVYPALVPNSHPLASIRGAYNAVFIESRSAGRLMFMGPGAGGTPTASAVLGDLVTAARNRLRGVPGPGESTYAARSLMPAGEVTSRFYVSLEVVDVPGVLAKVARAFADHQVSLQIVRQEGTGESARLGIMTHVAATAAITATVADLEAMTDVRSRVKILRVAGM